MASSDQISTPVLRGKAWRAITAAFLVLVGLTTVTVGTASASRPPKAKAVQTSAAGGILTLTETGSHFAPNADIRVDALVVQTNITEYGWATADGLGGFSTTVQIPLGVLTVNCTKKTCRDTGTVRVDAFQYSPAPQLTSAIQTLKLKTSPELTAVQIPDDETGNFSVQVNGSGFTPGATVGLDLYPSGLDISQIEHMQPIAQAVPFFLSVQSDGTFAKTLEEPRLLLSGICCTLTGNFSVVAVQSPNYFTQTPVNITEIEIG
jgi:hypothetical protein